MDSSDFSFDGIHLSDFGAVFLPSKWPGAAKITANEAAVPGRHGTIRYPGETYGEKALEGKLYLIDPDDGLMTYAQTLERADEVVAWLRPGGRRRLTLDAMPDRFYMAEITGELSVTTDDWDNGCMALKFTLQPFSYAAHESAVSFVLAANAGQTKTLYVPGNMPAPLLLTLTAREAVGMVQVSALDRKANATASEGVDIGSTAEASGTQAVNTQSTDAQRADVRTAGGKTLKLTGLGLTAGKVLASGEIMTCNADGAPAMGKVTAESTVPYELLPGARSVAVVADGACEVRVAVRGRWR